MNNNIYNNLYFPTVLRVRPASDTWRRSTSTWFKWNTAWRQKTCSGPNWVLNLHFKSQKVRKRRVNRRWSVFHLTRSHFHSHIILAAFRNRLERWSTISRHRASGSNQMEISDTFALKLRCSGWLVSARWQKQRRKSSFPSPDMSVTSCRSRYWWWAVCGRASAECCSHISSIVGSKWRQTGNHWEGIQRKDRKLGDRRTSTSC